MLESPIQNFTITPAITPQTIALAGVYNCQSLDLISMINGESVLSFVYHSGATTAGADWIVQDFQMSKVSNFASDVLTYDSAFIEHFIPQDYTSALNALAQTRIQGSSVLRKLGIHLPKHKNEYRYGRIRLLSANANSILLAGVYMFELVTKTA